MTIDKHKQTQSPTQEDEGKANNNTKVIIYKNKTNAI